MKNPIGTLALAVLAQQFIAPQLGAQAPIEQATSTITPPIAPVSRARPEPGSRLAGFQFPAVATPIHSQADDPENGAYGTWAAGGDYKISFHDGATFVPYLGEGYPHNQPFAWQTRSVSIGGIELLSGGKPDPRRASDFRFEYDFGAVVEAYDVRAEGAEQTFVIAERPASPLGDLVVAGEVTTALTANPTEGHTDVRFLDGEGRHLLTYGAATAVDAAGARRPMTTRFRNGRFELILDGAWLKDATFPVTVDPLMSTNATLNTSSGSTTGYFDVLRDDTRATENVWICYSRAASAGDRDLWVMRTNDNLPGSLFLVAHQDLSSSWSNLTCALAHARSRVVCAYVRNNGVERTIRWHTHQVNNLGFDSSFGFAPGASVGTKNWRVDVGGTRAFSTFGRVLVVYQREHGSGSFTNADDSTCEGFYVDVGNITTQVGQGTWANHFVINGSAIEDCERPTVNQVSNGNAANVWMTAHQVYNNAFASDDWDVSCRAFDGAGNPIATPRRLEDSNGAHKLGPVVEGLDGRYLVAYANLPETSSPAKPVLKTGHALRTMRLNFNGISGINLPHPVATVVSSPTAVHETGGMSFNSNTQSHWLVAHRDDSILWVDKCGYTGESTNFDNLYDLSVQPGTWTYPGRACFNDDNNTHVVIAGASVTGVQPIVGNVWSDVPRAAPTTAGTTCSTATLRLNAGAGRAASQKIGHEFNRVTVDGVPSGSFVVLAWSPSTANQSLAGVPGVGGGCRLLIDNSAGNFFTLGSRTVLLGTSTYWNLPLPASLSPATAHFQAFHTNATGTAFLTTRRLTVPIGH